MPQRTKNLLVASIAALALLALFGVAAPQAGARAHIAAAVVVGPRSQATASTCVQRVNRRFRRLARRASASALSRRKRRATKSALRRRCVEHPRQRSKKGSDPVPTGEPHPGPLVVGIDGGVSSWWDEEIEFREALNAPVTRHEWDPSEPVDAQDELMLEAAGEVHTRIHALLGDNELGDATHYREWVVAFIRRYGQGGSFWSEHPELDASKYAITTFELGNEPYFGGMTPTSYAETVLPTLEAVHDLGLPAKLILPSYIYGTNTNWIDTLYQRIPNLNELFYAFADHPYWYGHSPDQGGDGNSPFERIDTLRAKMAEHGAGDKPLFITEYGESTADCGSECVSESVQAEHLKTMLDAIVSRPDWGVELFTVFQLHDWATNSSDREQQFGLLRQDGTPKPAYSILREAMQTYRG